MEIAKDYLLVCENVILGGDEKLSLINLFDRLRGNDLPISYGQFYLAGRFIFSGKLAKKRTVPVEISLHTPSGKNVPTTIPTNIPTLDIEPFTGNTKKGILLGVPGIVMEEEGSYKFEVKIDNKVVAEVKISSEVVGSKK